MLDWIYFSRKDVWIANKVGQWLEIPLLDHNPDTRQGKMPQQTLGMIQRIHP